MNDFTFSSYKPQHSHVHRKVVNLLMTEYVPDYAQRNRISGYVDEVSI